MSSAPLQTVLMGGLRYPNGAKLGKAFALMAACKPSIRQLHLIRLNQISGDDLMQLAPRQCSSRSKAQDETTDLKANFPCLQKEVLTRVSDESSPPSGCASEQFPERETFLQKLEALSILECPGVSDAGLAAVLAHTDSLLQIVLVPDDSRAGLGPSNPQTVQGDSSLLKSEV